MKSCLQGTLSWLCLPPCVFILFSFNGKKWPNGATGFYSVSLASVESEFPFLPIFLRVHVNILTLPGLAGATRPSLNQLLFQFWDTNPTGHKNGEQRIDDGSLGQAEDKVQASAPSPHCSPPRGLCVVFLRRSWLPKDKGEGRKQMAN